MLHAKLCVIQKGYVGHCLVEGRGRGQIRLIDCLNHTACFWLYRVPVLYFIMMHLVLAGT
jgi:hypothetical protein